MNQMHFSQQQMAGNNMGMYGMPQHNMYTMGTPPVNMMGQPMGMGPQMNMLNANMGQMALSSGSSIGMVGNKNASMPSMAGGMNGSMAMGSGVGIMAQMQGFNASYSSYKGVS